MAMTAHTNRRLLRNGWGLVPLLLTLTVIGVPYLLTHGLPVAAMVLHSGFALVCHQQPERCFWIFGAPVAVCTRCLGIYLGASIGLLLHTSRRLAFQLLMIAAALNLLDVLTEFAGLHGNWLALRFVLGLSLGVTAALLVSSSIELRTTASAEIS
jgi:uncharacterized membrane protein